MSLTRLAVILTGVLFILIGVTTVTKTLELIFGIVIAALALLDWIRGAVRQEGHECLKRSSRPLWKAGWSRSAPALSGFSPGLCSSRS